MQLTGLSPMLWSDQLEETITFYSSILGFTLHNYNNTWGWAALCRDQVEIMMAKPNEHNPFQGPSFTGSLYINTDNVDELWNQLKDKTKIVYPIENFDWQMREFAIYDNNGYILQFGQDIATLPPPLS